MYEVVDNLSHQAGAHALRAGVDFLFNDDTITFPRSDRGSYTFSSLANFLTGVYNNAGFTQTFGTSVVSQTNPNLGVYAQDEWKAAPGLTVNAGLRYDLQLLQTIDTDTNNVSPRLGFAWTPTASRARSSAAAPACSTIACRCARSPTRCCRPATPPTSRTCGRRQHQPVARRRPARRCSRTSCARAVPLVTLLNLTTMDPEHAERVFAPGERRRSSSRSASGTTVSAGYQYTRGVESDHLGEPERAELRGGRHEQRLPADLDLRQQQPVLAVGGVGLSRPARLVRRSGPAAWGSYRVTYTLSKAMDNVGEFFFSSPIDPFDINKDWGRSDDDQRHRLVVTARESPTAGDTLGALSHGFQVSGMLQAYSALPFNITSGVTTIQGTAGRPIVERRVHRAQRRRRTGLLQPRRAPEPLVRVAGRVQLEGLAEGFNLTNRRTTWRSTAISAPARIRRIPSSTFGQITAVGDPRAFQTRGSPERYEDQWSRPRTSLPVRYNRPERRNGDQPDQQEHNPIPKPHRGPPDSYSLTTIQTLRRLPRSDTIGPCSKLMWPPRPSSSLSPRRLPPRPRLEDPCRRFTI